MQRGLGEGWLEAADTGSELASEWLRDCIVNDPRWDGQVESRSDYYAELALSLDLDLDFLSPSALGSQNQQRDHGLVIGVLGVLASDGHLQATELMLTHLAEGDHWDDAIWPLTQLDGAPPVGTINALLRRSDEELIFAARRWARELPWAEWAAEDARVARLVAEASVSEAMSSKARPRPPAADASLNELLGFSWAVNGFSRAHRHRFRSGLSAADVERLVEAASAEFDGGRRIAFTALAERGDGSLLPLAERTLRGGRPSADRAMALRYVGQLPSELSLPVVRNWLSDSELVSDAVYLMGRLAEPVDMPALAEMIPTAWERRDFYALASLIDAAARHPVVNSIDLLREVWSEAEYSYLRTRLVSVLVRDDRSFATEQATIARHDCEDSVRSAILSVGAAGG